MADRSQIDAVLSRSASQAREIAAPVIARVRSSVGLR